MQEQKSKQGRYEFSTIIFDSAFESGNLESVQMVSQSQFNLWIGADPNANYRTWFYFSVQGIRQGATITFTIMNMNNQVKLFKEGLVPIYRTDNSKEWARTKIPIAPNGIFRTQLGFQLSFKHNFTQKSKHYFSFTYPWTNLDNQGLIQQLMQNKPTRLYCQNQKLCLSFKGRPINLHIVTRAKKNQQLKFDMETINQNNIPVFPGRKGVFISARVHPGETASSHIMNGILKQIYRQNPLSQCLLENCVFYILPIINPDGVAEGNFRTDSQGKNLNRYYCNPKKQEEPQIFHIKQFLVSMIKRKLISFCLDLHAHVNKQGAFIYGNSTGILSDQIKVCLFPKLLSFNNEIFDFNSCNFSEKNMTSKDKGDELSKEGASRVAIFKETGLAECWTLQCNYNSAKLVQVLLEPSRQNKNNNVSHGVLCSRVEPDFKEDLQMLNVSHFEGLGFSILESIADFYQLKESSRVFSSKLKNMVNLEINLAVISLRLIPFRFDIECRKILDNLNNTINIKACLDKLSFLIRKKQDKFFQLKQFNHRKSLNSVEKISQGQIKGKIESREKRISKKIQEFQNDREKLNQINSNKNIKTHIKIPSKRVQKPQSKPKKLTISNDKNKIKIN